MKEDNLCAVHVGHLAQNQQSSTAMPSFHGREVETGSHFFIFTKWIFPEDTETLLSTSVLVYIRQ